MLRAYKPSDVKLVLQLFEQHKDHDKVAEEMEKKGFVSSKTSKPLSPQSIRYIITVAKAEGITAW